MLAMEYGTVGMAVQQHKYACSTMSSETISESCGSRNNRIRTVRLVRPVHGPLPPPGLSYRHGPSLGFSIRGGREHGTGIFVSHVESGSEAHAQGLRVGDQIIRINGFTVDDAVHKEVLQLISNHTHLTLKVRGVGMLPVKDKKTDGLSWHIITERSSPTRESPQLGDKLNDVRINIMIAPKSKLGCGICKGPDWKPGIFVQFTKEGGIARDAGLRPGDQILYCNNVDFSDIPFNEAVGLMKSARQLNLIIRKSAGSELFPGESSGYNSSASSVTGDQSPSWSDSKRLSIVKEENLDLGERLNHLNRYQNSVNVEKWDSWDDEHDEKPLFKPTIINLSENRTTIHNNGSEEPIVEEYSTCSVSSSLSTSSSNTSNIYQPYNNSKNAKNNDTTEDIYSLCQKQNIFTPYNNSKKSKINDTTEDLYALCQKQRETKTVTVDVHRSDGGNRSNKVENGHMTLMKSASSSSFCSIASKSSCTSSVTSSMTTNSLSSAITQEIQRRSQKKTLEAKPSIDDQLQIKRVLKGVSTEKQYQHCKLMDEFKKVHQKMFKNNDVDDESDSISKSSSFSSGDQIEDRLNNNNNNKELTQKLNERLSNLQNGTNDETKRLTSNKISTADSTPPPPPPPPLKNGSLDSSTMSTPASSTPSTRSNTLKSTKPKAPPVPVKYSVLSYNQSPTNCAKTSSSPLTNGYNSSSPQNNHHQPPPCPSPDYDTLSLTSTTSSHTTEAMRDHQVKNGGGGGDMAEMESLESFKINNPSDVKPRPPSTYFQKRLLTSSVSNQSSNTTSNTSTIRRSRPVSVTIGEYPSMRRQPGKLDFLQNGVHGGPGGRNGDDLGSRLTSELTQTLNRSNLKKRTESMENLLGDSKTPSQIKTQRNGAVRISLSNLSKAFAKSTSDLTEDTRTRYDTLPNRPTNRVTINVNLAANKQNNSDSGGSTPPSGILKNGGTTAAEGHKVLAAQKSITFGEM